MLAHMTELSLVRPSARVLPKCYISRVLLDLEETFDNLVQAFGQFLRRPLGVINHNIQELKGVLWKPTAQTGLVK